MYIYIYTYINTSLSLSRYIYIYIYIYISQPRASARRRGSSRRASCRAQAPRGPGGENLLGFSGKDTGGPSKGGFLKNRLFSYIYIYIYTHTINFIAQIYTRIWNCSIIQEITFTRTTFVLRQALLAAISHSCRLSWLSVRASRQKPVTVGRYHSIAVVILRRTRNWLRLLVYLYPACSVMIQHG